MKPFQDLSKAGKLRRLRQLAEAAIVQYDLVDPVLTYHGFDTNLLYRVSTASGERFMLRLAVPGWREYSDLCAEALWLEALSRDTSLAVVRILPARSGEYVLPVSLPGIPTTWNASLMTWVPGRLLGQSLTAPNLEKMGALFAGLHRHGAAWVPPAGFSTRRFEHWESRDDPIRIVGEQMSGEAAALPAHHRELLERMHRRVEQAYAAVDRADLRVIHCDLWHDNIKLYRGVLHPLDFEDTVWGFRAHDIAMAMLDLLETTGEERYPALLAAFQRGYQSGLDWPEDPIEVFQIGRLLWKINWVANHQARWLESMVERHVPVFEEYERSGKVILPAPPA